MSIAVDVCAESPAQPLPRRAARVALLGCGTVGRAFASLAALPQRNALPVHITGALVRDARRVRPRPLPPLTEDALALFTPPPDAVVELLGGVDPARALVLEALTRGIPVVTANKTLLAHYGHELRQAAHDAGTPLLYEAAVIAGVPFLGMFSRRPRAAAATGLSAIANGTTNFVLTRCAAEGCDIDEALADAQRRGYAEPDPRSDMSGADAREKLAVLLQQFAHLAVAPEDIETIGLDQVRPDQTAHARELGGVIKPLILAAWDGPRVEAFAGPAFLPADHPLAAVDGVDNALILNTPHGRLRFQGPGAGPDVTAATVLDDLTEVLSDTAVAPPRPVTAATPTAPETGWLLTLEATRLPRGADVADLLAAHGLFAHRVTATHTRGGRESRSLLLWPARRAVLQRAMDALCAAAGCAATALRAPGDER